MDPYLGKLGELLSSNIITFAIILAFLIPVVRAWLYKLGKVPKPTVTRTVLDILAGLLLPHFVGIILLPYFPGLLTKIERHAYAVTGIVGIVVTVRELFLGDRE